MDGLRVTLSFIHFLITRPVGFHRRPDPEEGIWLHQHHRRCNWQARSNTQVLVTVQRSNIRKDYRHQKQPITTFCRAKFMVSDTEHRLRPAIHFPCSLRRIKSRDRMDDTSVLAFRKSRVQFSACRPAFVTDKFSTIPLPSRQKPTLKFKIGHGHFNP